MYKKHKLIRSKMNVNESYEGESIEKKIRRIVNNKEPITDGAPLVYTERKSGTLPEYDIRTDRWEVAVEAMDKVTQTFQAQREERQKTPEQKEIEKLAKEAKNNMKKEGESPANTSDN